MNLPLSKTKVLITVLTYPHPSEKYKELICTAGVTEDGRLSPFTIIEGDVFTINEGYIAAISGESRGGAFAFRMERRCF